MERRRGYKTFTSWHDYNVWKNNDLVKQIAEEWFVGDTRFVTFFYWVP